MKDNKKPDKMEKLFLHVIDAAPYEPVVNVEKPTRGYDYISWGEDNMYPQYLYDIYLNCSTLQSVINGLFDFTIGDGIVLSGLPASFNMVNSKGEHIIKVLTKMVLDRWIFGGYACQVIYNQFYQLSEIIYLDFRKLRTSKLGDIIWYSEIWGSYGQNFTNVKYPKFDKNRKIEGEYSQVYYVKGDKTRSCYPIPDYNAALTSAEIQVEIKKFHKSNILNNFNSDGILAFHGAENVDDDTKDKVEKAVNDKFCGSRNGGRLMVAWGSGESGIDYKPITDSQFDKKYEALADSTREDLFISLRCAPQLFGLSVSTGFANIEYQEAFDLCMRTVVSPVQESFITEMKYLFGDTFQMEFLPFTLKKAKDENVEDEEETDETVTDTIIKIVENPAIPADGKRMILRDILKLSDEQINTLLPYGTETQA